MVKNIHNLKVEESGAMVCFPDLPDRVDHGMGCEAVERAGVITWVPCGPSVGRPHTRLKVAEDSSELVYRPELCIKCGAESVFPLSIDFSTEGSGRWDYMLVCGACGHTVETVLTTAENERLMDIYLEQIEEICIDANNLKILTNGEIDQELADEVDRFADALRADFILPEDF